MTRPATSSCASERVETVFDEKYSFDVEEDGIGVGSPPACGGDGVGALLSSTIGSANNVST
jgi:hypothetical protein